MIFSVQSIITIVSIIGVLSILGALALFISHTLKKEHEFQEKERATFNEYEKIIKRAHEDAATLLEKATETSRTLLTQTKDTNQTVMTDFDKVLQEIASRQIQALNSEAATLKQGYQTKINQMEHTVDQNTTAMLTTAETNLEKQLQTFSQTMINHAAKSEQMMSQKTQEMMQKVEEELSNYKKSKMENMDAKILALIQKTYQDILGKTIPPTVHQELILEALEKSKKEGAFDV